jgi:hypothetical protein
MMNRQNDRVEKNTRRNVENLKYLLKKESRAEIYLNNNLKAHRCHCNDIMKYYLPY